MENKDFEKLMGESNVDGTHTYTELLQMALEYQALIKDTVKQVKKAIIEIEESGDFKDKDHTLSNDLTEQKRYSEEIASRHLGLSRRKMISLRNEGKIRHKRFGNRVKYCREYIDEFVENCPGNDEINKE